MDEFERDFVNDIMPLVENVFDVVEVKGCGGALLHLLLEHIAGNFSSEDPDSVDYLFSLFDAEDRLTAEGKLKHDFAIIIARKKTTPGTCARYCANRVLSFPARRNL